MSGHFVAELLASFRQTATDMLDSAVAAGPPAGGKPAAEPLSNPGCDCSCAVHAPKPLYPEPYCAGAAASEPPTGGEAAEEPPLFLSLVLLAAHAT